MKASKIYEILSSIFTENLAVGRSIKLQKIYSTVIMCLVVLQNFKIMWTSTMSLPSWRSYSPFWKAIGKTSFDNLASDLNLLFPYLIFVISTHIIIISIIIWQIIRKLSNKEAPKYFIRILRYFLMINCDLNFIPGTIVLVLMFKYSLITDDVIREYFNTPNSSTLNLGLAGKVISVIFLTLNLVIAIIYEGFSFEIRHSYNKYDINSKARPNIDIFVKVFQFGYCFMFAFFIEDHFIVYLSIYIVINAFFVFKFCYSMPYYSYYMNFIKILIHFEGATIGLYFILACVIENGTTVIVLSIFMQPLLPFFIKLLIDYRVTLLKTASEITSFDVFELTAREMLTSSEKSEQLIKFMNTNFKREGNKLIYVYQANYCQDILHNSSIAGVKISQIKFTGFTFISNFQVFKCQQKLEKFNFKTNEALRLCLFLLKYDQVIKNEKHFCINYLELLNKSKKENPQLSEIKRTLEVFYKELDKILEKYDFLVQNYPDSQIVNKDIATFMIDILYDQDKGQIYINKLNQLLQKKKYDKKIDFFSDPNACLMIVSGKRKNAGKIVFASPTLCSLLEISYEEAKEHFIGDFIPKPYAFEHQKVLENFAETVLNTFTYECVSAIMCSKDGFLIECLVSTECVGYNSKVVFVTMIQPILNDNNEIAILNDIGQIMSHSKGFPKLFGVESPKLNYELLTKFISKNDYISLKNHENVAYTSSLNSNKGAFLSLKPFSIFKIPVSLLRIEKEEFSGNTKNDKTRSTFYLDQSNNITELKFDNVEDNEKFILNTNEIIITDENAYLEKNRLTSKTTSKSTSSFSTYTKNIKHFITVLRIFQCFKICLTLTIISVILSLFVLLGYVYSEILHAISLNSLLHIGSLYFNLSKLGLYARSLDLSNQFLTEYFFNQENFHVIIEDLNTLNSQISKDYDQWSYCPFSQIIKESIVDVWFQETKNTMIKENLVDIVNDVVCNAKEMEKNLVSKKLYEENLFYILYNGFRVSMHELEKAFNGFNKCEVQRTNDMNYMVTYLTIFGSVLFSVLFLILSASIFVLNKKQSAIWGLLIVKIKENYKTIKGNILNRLTRVHNNTDYDALEDNLTTKDRFSINHSIKYLLIVSSLILIITFFYLSFYFIFYNKILEYLLFRLDFLNVMVNRRTKLTQASYFSLEIIANNKNQDLANRFSNFTIFPEPEMLFEKLITELSGISQVFLNPSYKKNTPKNVWILINDKFENSNPILKYGISPAYKSLMLIDLKDKLEYADMGSYFNDINDVIDSFENINPITDQALKNKVLDEFYLLMVFDILAAFVLISLCLFIYKVYFTREKKEMEYIKSVLRIIPEKLDMVERSTNMFSS
ncbi:hypothetical protein SteCoe_37652 [Stentor coeruleus]|uniref:PAS domain-containing protein n=1 Tax=Stentor coeruleus TaxID=5963 RepID=A0A1R2AMP1_9CILI|nr:hypothetical protein SteCoe_37652 [Stentor coeruleus]